jgi:hypothetical protein
MSKFSIVYSKDGDQGSVRNEMGHTSGVGGGFDSSKSWERNNGMQEAGPASAEGVGDNGDANATSSRQE